MHVVTLKGNPLTLSGALISAGDTLPTGTLTAADLSQIDIPQGRCILNFFPSIDTPTCALQTRYFNQKANDLGVPTYTISMDLPFALGRFCGAEKLENIHTVSDFRHKIFANSGLVIADSPLAGLYARAVIIADDGIVSYVQLVPEIASEPDYDAVIQALKA